MPERTPGADGRTDAEAAADAIVASGSQGLPGEDFGATDAFLMETGLVPPREGEAPAADETTIQPPADADKPSDEEKLFLGRYKTVEELEKHAKHFQSEADSYRADAEIARKYPTLLQTLESDPEFKNHIASYWEEGGEDGAAPADQPLTRREFAEMLAERDNRQAVESNTVNQIKQLMDDHGLTQEQARDFVEKDMRAFTPTLSDAYRLLHIDDELAAAKKGGKDEVTKRTLRATNRLPAMGVQTGAVPSRRSFNEQQADEIVAASQGKAKAIAELGL